MEADKIAYWRTVIDNGERWMRPKREIWKRLLQLYRLELKVAGYADEDVVRVSRFYPLTRQIITAIAFQYPHIFIKVEDNNYRYGSETLEKIANDALEIMRVKKEVQQACFDALYCCLGWLKFGYNPPGNNDAIAPYVMADDLQNDFPFVRRVSPFNMIPDPLTPPHNIAHARYLIEKMLVPLEFAKKDDRYSYRDQLQPIQASVGLNSILEAYEEAPTANADEQAAYEEAKSEGKMVLLYEIHDRLHQRRITFAAGVDQPIEDIEHPFLETEPAVTRDPATGQDLLTGDYRLTGGYLVEGGFPYHAIKFDMSDESIYGLPMMGYVEDEQQTITESVTRRADLLKRYSRIVLGQRSEREANPDAEQEMRDAKDGTIVWVQDVDKAFRDLQWGAVPQDQLGIESDMRQYEEQVLQVSQLALGGSSRMTATQASLIASFGQLNREWLQDSVAEAYRVTTINVLRIMADDRYTPEGFYISLGPNEAEQAYMAVSADMLKARYKIRIEANSMRPLFEELEKEDTLALVNYLIQTPEVNRREVIQLILRAFRVPNPEKFLGPDSDAEAVRAAQLENQFMVSRMQDPGVLPQQNHMVHLRTHQQAQTDPAVLQFLQQSMQMNPAAAQGFMQVMQMHMQQHQQASVQRNNPQGMGAGAGAAGGSPNRVEGMRDAAGMGGPGSGQPTGVRSPVENAQNLQSTVRGNAQRTANAVSVNPNQH